jgi:hypothetical protein
MAGKHKIERVVVVRKSFSYIQVAQILENASLMLLQPIPSYLAHSEEETW